MPAVILKNIYTVYTVYFDKMPDKPENVAGRVGQSHNDKLSQIHFVTIYVGTKAIILKNDKASCHLGFSKY